MALGWLTDLDEGNTYFKEERLRTKIWDDLMNDMMKTKALTNAYNRIYYCKDYSIPDPPSESELAKLKIAQCEMAYYMALHLADEDRRKGLQVQGVIVAGIVKEQYDKDMLEKLAIPAIVKDLLEDFKTEEAMAIIDIDRDEDESVDTKVDEF